MKTNENNELSGFWEMVEILASSGKIWMEVDFHIRISNGKPFWIKEAKTPLELPREKRYLSLSFQRIAQLYAKESRDTESKKIPKDSLKYYLENSREFIGTKKSERFKVVENAVGFIPAGNNAKGKITTAMLFDYDLLEKNYDIHLDISQMYAAIDDQIEGGNEVQREIF